MSAIPGPAALDTFRPGGLAVPAAVVTAGRTLVLLALVLFVPGEAARIGERI